MTNAPHPAIAASGIEWRAAYVRAPINSAATSDVTKISAARGVSSGLSRPGSAVMIIPYDVPMFGTESSTCPRIRIGQQIACLFC